MHYKFGLLKSIGRENAIVIVFLVLAATVWPILSFSENKPSSESKNDRSERIAVNLPKSSDLKLYLISKSADNHELQGLEITVALEALPELEYFTLSDPARLVVDFAYKPKLTNASIKLSQAGHLSSIRLASHSDKLRLVLDSSLPQFPTPRAELLGKVLKIWFETPQSPETSNHEAALQTAPKPPPPLKILSAQRVNAAQQLPVAQPKAEVGLDQIASTKELTPVEIVASPENIDSPDASKAQVLFEALSFLGGHAGKPARISFKFSAQPRYRLAKKGDTSYALEVSDSIVGADYLSLPYFPPQDFEGLTFVSAKQADNKTIITIGIEPGARLEVEPGNNEILVWTRNFKEGE